MASGPDRVVVVIPAGRRRYLELLIPQILREPGWDEVHLWANTTIGQDLADLREVASQDERISVLEPPEQTPSGPATIGQFFRYAQDPHCVYIRFDDDICWIQPGLVQALVDERRTDRQSFLLSPLTINNALTTYILQQFARITIDGYVATPYVMDPITWKSADFAYQLHAAFIHTIATESVESWRVPDVHHGASRFSINCVSWLGEHMTGDAELLRDDEETVLSSGLPVLQGRGNRILGSLIVAHFAFGPQREKLERTQLLDAYAGLSQQGSAPVKPTATASTVPPVALTRPVERLSQLSRHYLSPELFKDGHYKQVRLSRIARLRKGSEFLR